MVRCEEAGMVQQPRRQVALSSLKRQENRFSLQPLKEGSLAMPGFQPVRAISRVLASRALSFYIGVALSYGCDSLLQQPWETHILLS